MTAGSRVAHDAPRSVHRASLWAIVTGVAIVLSLGGVSSAQADAVTGVISGTPTASGTFTFTVTATNAAGSDAQGYTLSIGLAATGAEDPVPIVLVAGGLLLAGLLALVVVRVTRSRSRGQ